MPRSLPSSLGAGSAFIILSALLAPTPTFSTHPFLGSRAAHYGAFDHIPDAADSIKKFHDAELARHQPKHPSHRERRRLDKTSDVTVVDHDLYKTFVPDNATHTCSSDEHTEPFNEQVRGVNLGSWMVLEPWITPSLFYQFLGGQEGTAAFDHYSFCEVLGPEEGNKQLRRHWATWLTREHVATLAGANVNSLRLPIGDFQFIPYGPYEGCVDGGLDFVDELLDWAAEFNMTVLFDVHTQKGSQNGFDNSGQQMGTKWTSKFNLYPAGLTTFEHWPIQTAEWVGKFNRDTLEYDEIYEDNIKHSLEVIRRVVARYKDHPAVLGIEPVNEPWWFTPMDILKQFYWEGYLIVKKTAPDWKYVIHDSFRFSPQFWGGFMDGCPDRAMDAHMYQAWQYPSSRVSFYDMACNTKNDIAEMENAFGPIIVGEWSLATDNCAMWLNGFNDNLPGFPMLPCKYVPCAEPYMGPDQPGTPVDPGQPLQGPYGTGTSGPSWGLCPTSRDWLKEHAGDPDIGSDWIRAPAEAPEDRDATDEVMTNLARKKFNGFSGVGHGFYFWNFRSEIDNPQWSYLDAVSRNWITTGSLHSAHISSACRREDQGSFSCVAKRNVLDKTLRGGIAYALNAEGQDASFLNNLTGTSLAEEGDKIYHSYWRDHRVDGVTCDFGGTATLTQLNASDTDDEFDDDWTEVNNFTQVGISKVGATVIALAAAFLGSFVGFVIAMKTSKKFNYAVRKSVVFKNVKNSKIFHGRKSLLGSEQMPFISDTGNYDSGGRYVS